MIKRQQYYASLKESIGFKSLEENVSTNIDNIKETLPVCLFGK